MIAQFIATQSGTQHDASFITTGVASANPPHYLSFSRSLPLGSNEDWGIEIEFDDQATSGYEAIDSCSLIADRLRVELTGAIGRNPQYTGFDITLRLGESDKASLAAALRTIFTGYEELLSFDEENA